MATLLVLAVGLLVLLLIGLAVSSYVFRVIFLACLCLVWIYGAGIVFRGGSRGRRMR